MKRQAPVFLGFFVMGFVDVVGIATNYAKKDFQLRDSVANLLPFMVFLWFAFLSVPLGSLMNRLGRRMTVMIGLAVTAMAMLVPLADYSFVSLLIAFALVGIGNTILQVSLNPLLMNVVGADRLASALTGGQLAKSLASFLGPVIAAAASAYAGSWREIFWVFAAVSVLNGIWLWGTQIPEVSVTPGVAPGKELSARDSLRLLGDGKILMLVIGVICIVGIDVGLNTTLPKFVMGRCGIPLEKAGFASSLYFMSRTAGSLAGIPLLGRFTGKQFLAWTAALGMAALALLLAGSEIWLLGIAIVLLGFAVANIFPILFSTALQQAASYQNEVSGLMIMGVAGGAILLPVMGFVEDVGGAGWALGCLALAWAFLWWISRRF
ncbi:MAG TPA: MFS transporter [Puia sp.]|jgi:fucose permease|nr:MFS transporter [Puia sp.]